MTKWKKNRVLNLCNSFYSDAIQENVKFSLLNFKLNLHTKTPTTDSINRPCITVISLLTNTVHGNNVCRPFHHGHLKNSFKFNWQNNIETNYLNVKNSNRTVGEIIFKMFWKYVITESHNIFVSIRICTRN